LCTFFSCIILIRPQILQQTTETKKNYENAVVLPENPIILDRWGRIINRTTIGPMEEGDDVILSCRVVGGKLIFLLLHDVSSGNCVCYFLKFIYFWKTGLVKRFEWHIRMLIHMPLYYCFF
jgi:hypothetical protein